MLKAFKQKPNKTQDRLGSKVLGLESGHKPRDTSLKTPDSGLKTQHRSVRGIGVGGLIGVAILYLLSSIHAPAQPSVPPPKTTAFTRGLIGTNTTSAEFRAALGFLSTNNTVITNYTGNGASITNLNASELRSGTVPLARLSGITASQVADATLTTNKVDATFHALLGGGGSGDVTAAGLAAGSYALKATNLFTIDGNSKTNGVSILAQPLVTNSAMFVGNGSIQMPQFVYGQSGSVANYRNGLIFWPNGWNGTPYAPGDAVSVPMAAIQCATNWGGGDGTHVTTLHIFSRGDIRIEPTYSGEVGHAAYLSIGNEDTPHNIFINQCEGGSGGRGNDGPDMAGYSLNLTFASKGRFSNEEYYSNPGIQSYFVSTNHGQSDAYGNIYYPGGLKFFARLNSVDRYTNTIGTEAPTFGWEVGRTLTNGWRFNGNIEYKQAVPLLDANTNIILDFNSDSYGVLNLPHPVATNYIQATNMNIYGGNTNYTAKVFKLISGAIDKPLKFPASWSVVSESGSAALPTLLAAQRVMVLKLQTFGDTNVVADFQTGVDAGFAFDADASSFSNRVGVALSTAQMGAVDYLVKAMKETTIIYSNLWSKTRVLYPMVGGTSNAHAMNLRSTSYPVIYTSSGVTHDANGITGNGTSGYGNTQFTHNNTGAETNMHLLVYCRTTAPVDSSRFIGAYNSAGSQRAGLSRSGASLAADGPMNGNAPTTLQSVSTDFRGVLAVTRPNNDPNLIYSMNRSAFATNSSAAVGTIPVTYDILARHAQSGDAHFNYSDANIALVSIGDGLTIAEMEAFRAIVNNYQQILGRNVP